MNTLANCLQSITIFQIKTEMRRVAKICICVLIVVYIISSVGMAGLFDVISFVIVTVVALAIIFACLRFNLFKKWEYTYEVGFLLGSMVSMVFNIVLILVSPIHLNDALDYILLPISYGLLLSGIFQRKIPNETRTD